MRLRRRSSEFDSAQDHRGAEVHRFEERLFVLTRLSTTWGARVPDDASAEELGAIVLDAMARTQRTQSPSLVVGLDELHRERAREQRELERFCRDVAGVDPAHYSPEISVDVYESGNEIWIRPRTCGLDDERKVVLPADAAAAAIGETVLQVVKAEQPRWSALQRASVYTVGGGRLIIQPVRQTYVTGPMIVLDGSEGLGDAIATTLQESGNDDPSALDYEAALRAVGATWADLAGGAGVDVVRNTRGEIVLTATHRVSEAHSWELARDGVLLRRVVFAGDQGEALSEGEPTDVERRLGLEDVTFDSDVDEDTVMDIAAAWSLDPRLLDTTPTSAPTGTFGERRS